MQCGFLGPLGKYKSHSCSEEVVLRFYFCNDLSGVFPRLSTWLTISFKELYLCDCATQRIALSKSWLIGLVGFEVF